MDDANILALYFDRNEDAITETDRAYGRRLFHLAEHILHNPQDSEESVSDTYLRAWNTIPPKRPAYFYAYLAKICRNLSLDKLDWHSAAKRNAEVVSLTEEMERCIPAPGSDISLDDRQLGALLNDFLAALTPENRMIFVRRYWYVETTAEIAQRYGIKEGTLITRLHRIRVKLAEYLNKEGMKL